MKLTDAERTENREALASMNPLQKIDHLLEYYRFPLVLLLIAAVALGSLLYYRLTRKETLLYVAYVNISVGDTLDSAISDGYVRAVGANPGKREVKLYRGLYLSQDATESRIRLCFPAQGDGRHDQRPAGRASDEPRGL